MINYKLKELIEITKDDPDTQIILATILAVRNTGYLKLFANHIRLFAKYIIIPTLERDVSNIQARDN